MTRILSKDLVNFNSVIIKNPRKEEIDYAYNKLVASAESFKIVDKDFVEFLKDGKGVKLEILYSPMTEISVNARISYLRTETNLRSDLLSTANGRYSTLVQWKEKTTYLRHKEVKDTWCHSDNSKYPNLLLFNYDDSEFLTVGLKSYFDDVKINTLVEDYKFMTAQEMRQSALKLATFNTKGGVKGTYIATLRLIPVLRVWIENFKGVPYLFYVNLANFHIEKGISVYPEDPEVTKKVDHLKKQERLLTLGITAIPLLSLLVFYILPSFLHYPIKDLKWMGLVAFILLIIGSLVLFFLTKLEVYSFTREAKGSSISLRDFPKHIFKIVLGYLVVIAVPVLLCIFA